MQSKKERLKRGSVVDQENLEETKAKTGKSLFKIIIIVFIPSLIKRELMNKIKEHLCEVPTQKKYIKIIKSKSNNCIQIVMSINIKKKETKLVKMRLE